MIEKFVIQNRIWSKSASKIKHLFKEMSSTNERKCDVSLIICKIIQSPSCYSSDIAIKINFFLVSNPYNYVW
jgi:hypothetical protein